MKRRCWSSSSQRRNAWVQLVSQAAAAGRQALAQPLPPPPSRLGRSWRGRRARRASSHLPRSWTPCWAGGWRRGPSQSSGEGGAPDWWPARWSAGGARAAGRHVMQHVAPPSLQCCVPRSIACTCLQPRHHRRLAWPRRLAAACRAWARRSWACSWRWTCRYLGPLAGWAARLCTSTQVGTGQVLGDGVRGKCPLRCPGYPRPQPWLDLCSCHEARPWSCPSWPLPSPPAPCFC